MQIETWNKKSAYSLKRQRQYFILSMEIYLFDFNIFDQIQLYSNNNQ